MEEDYTTSQGGRLNHPDDIRKYFSHRTFLDFVLDKTNPLVYVRLLMDGKYFLEKSSFQAQLHQKTNQHDEFTIIIPDNSMDSFEGIIMENSKKIIGKTITAEFWRFGTVKQSFTGIITKLKNTKKHGYGYLHIMGNSPTIMMEHGLECQSFEGKNLAEIIKNITKEYSSELNIDTDNLNQYNKQNTIPYTVQYKETDYQFLQRLAKRYGEFFYYNGQRLIFGNKTEKKILLEEGKELKEFEMELTTRPQNFQYSTYDGVSGQELHNDTQNVPDLFGKTNPFQTTAYNASKQLYKKTPKAFHSQTSLDKASSDLHNAILKEKESRQNLVEVKGKSIDPELRQGCLIEMRDFNDRPLETYRITEIKHFYDGNNYENEFTAFNDAIVPLYYDENAFPNCEEQYARIMDNNDPIGSGRVRVQFAWQKEKNTITPWLRLIQPHSGANKGFSFIPEIGEEVLVGFESMNAETPFILGTQYNGAETSGYHTSGNDFKVIKTRSGHHLTFEELKNITLADAKGNKFHIDSEGSNINIIALETINIKCKNFNIDVEENMKTQVGKNINTNAGKDIKTIAKDDISQDSGKKTIIASGDNTEITAKKDLDLYGKKKLIGYTDGKTEFGAKEQMHVYGASSLITAQNKIEYKAPKMNKLAESGKFKFDKQKQIISVKWMDNEMKERIGSATFGDKVSLLVQTRNYEEGETVTIKIKEKDGGDVKEGEKELTLKGKVNAEGFAELKEEVEIEEPKAQVKPDQSASNDLSDESDEQNENAVYKQYKGKDYTKAEWKAFDDEQYKIYLEKKNKKGFWG